MHNHTRQSRSRVAARRAQYAAFVFPLLGLYVLFFIVPFFMGLSYAGLRWDGISPERSFVGFANFVSILNDPDYLSTVWFTLRFAAFNVILTNVVALALALALDRPGRGTNALRVLFFLPNVISALVAGFIWTFILRSALPTLAEATGLLFLKQNWLGDPTLALGSTVMVASWQSIGYTMVIYLAGLQSIDRSVLESAAIDGATGWKKLTSVTVPLMMPSITVNLFMTVSQSFRLFDLNTSLTSGGPGKSTLSMALDIYREGFGNNNMGLASAKAIVLFILVFAVTIIQLRFTKRREVQA